MFEKSPLGDLRFFGKPLGDGEGCDGSRGIAGLALLGWGDFGGTLDLWPLSGSMKLTLCVTIKEKSTPTYYLLDYIYITKL